MQFDFSNSKSHLGWHLNKNSGGSCKVEKIESDAWPYGLVRLKQQRRSNLSLELKTWYWENAGNLPFLHHYINILKFKIIIAFVVMYVQNNGHGGAKQRMKTHKS